MPEYIFNGTLSLSNVNFYIIADNEHDAKEKARRGEYVDWDIGDAGSVDWTINPNSIELNE